VTVDAIIRVLLAMPTPAAAGGRRGRCRHDSHGPACTCRHALDHALITAPEVRDPALVERLRSVAGRVL
jgi:5'-methylthioadenosine phosphorylase